ncbi:hypothetical protein N1031_00020 [Herbiconiux moechotypicola]|uniref:Uncharacterized protein n=1 Tax=Herbiconiux moechotypicola TaxID=637393 RepID=A0ABN3D8Z7_9MICO|nr:hypothetical protein [Herbiconiux moechotypicola]MCS5728135.1 hypothetical protein [Herbiconiux moechotypicola]
MAVVHERLSSTSWIPEHRLHEGDYVKLLTLAKSDRVPLRNGELEDRLKAVRGAAISDPRVELLAANTLDLLVQIKHGIQLDGLIANNILALADPHSGCWGLVTVDRGAVDIRVRSQEVTALREGTVNLLSVLNVEDRLSERAFLSRGQDVLEVDGKSIQSNRGGEEEAKGTVHVLGRLGFYFYAARRPGPIALLIISAALLAISLAMLVVGLINTSLAMSQVYVWIHNTIDRIFTGALGAALVTIVTTAQSLLRYRRLSGTRVVIDWV